MNCNTALFERMKNIKMWKSWKTLRALCQERGAVFVLTAVLLPVLCGFMGIAYDVGNLYMHKTKLQNVTDAAALAGGAVFKERSDQKTDEKSGTRINFIPNNHKQADDAATTFIDKNKIDLGSNIVIDELSALPGLKSTTTSNNGNVSIEKQNIYYRVIASDTVPLYFLPVIMSNTHDQLVRTASVAMLETTTRTTTSGGGGSSQPDKTILDNLFTFSESLNMVNVLARPDLDATTKVAPNYLDTFDGAVVFTNSSSQITMQNNANAINYMLPASGAKGFQKTFYEIIDAYTSYGEMIDIDFASDTYQNMFKKKFTSSANAGTRVDKLIPDNGQPAKITSDILNSHIAAGKNIFIYNKTTQGNIQINKPLNGNSKDPIFIKHDDGHNAIHVNCSVDTNRPIVLVYLGAAEIVVGDTNGTFRGIIYAPKTLVQVHNSNNFKFYGNIIAKKIDIQGGDGSMEFHLVNYLKDDPDFKDLPVYTHRAGSVTQAVYDATFKEALQELTNGTSSINVTNGWRYNNDEAKMVFSRVYDYLYNNDNPSDILNDPTKFTNGDSNATFNNGVATVIGKSDFFRTWAYAYESTLNKLKARYADFQLSDLNYIDKVSWDNDVPSSGGGGGSGETTVTKSSTLRLINPRTEDNPYFNSESKI